MKEILSDEESSHPLNESLLKEANKIKEERETLKARLEKLKESAGQVSQSVYQRVHDDYATRLDKTTGRLMSLRDDLENELKILLEKKNLVEVNITLHKENIEESHLRHALGEYSSEQHQEGIKKEHKELQRLESAREKLNEGMARHQKIFEGESFFQEPPPPPPSEEPMPPPEPEPPPPPETPPSPEPSPPPPVAEEVRISEQVAQDTARIRIESEIKPAYPPSKSTTAAPRVPELLVYENGKVVQTVPLDKTIFIGRSPSNEVVLKELKVSRKHAEIQPVKGKYILLDHESSNGTFVGGKKITEHTLLPNDEITIGNTKMVFKT